MNHAGRFVGRVFTGEPLFSFAREAIFDVVFRDHGRHPALQARVLPPVVILLAAEVVTITYVSTVYSLALSLFGSGLRTCWSAVRFAPLLIRCEAQSSSYRGGQPIRFSQQFSG